MNTLTRAMHDAADEAPTTLDHVDDQWVTASWRSGRRRRAVRGAAAGAGLAAAAALVVSLVVSGIGGMPNASIPADGSSRSARDGITSFPQRIGHQWWVGDLPAAPGPVAGVVSVVRGDNGSQEWQVVRPGGTRYGLPSTRMAGGTFPAVSPDGTRLGWLADDESYRVQDLLTGRVTRFPQLGTANLQAGSTVTFVGGRNYGLMMQSPGLFSPSGDALAVLASAPSSARWGGVLVLQGDGSVTEVPVMNQAAGWLDDDRLLGRTLDEQTAVEQTQQGDTSVNLVVWDRRTGETTPLVRVELPEPQAQTINSLYGQFWGSIRSDGTLWLTYSVEVPTGSISQNQRLVGYSLPSGAPVAVDGQLLPVPAPVVEVDDEKEVVSFMRFWHDASALAGTDGDVTAVVPAGRSGDPLVVVDPSADVTQVIWAEDAIDGSPSWAVFGTSTLPLFWWWKEIALVALALGVWRWWLARRRRRRAATIDST